MNRSCSVATVNKQEQTGLNSYISNRALLTGYESLPNETRVGRDNKNVTCNVRLYKGVVKDGSNRYDLKVYHSGSRFADVASDGRTAVGIIEDDCNGFIWIQVLKNGTPIDWTGTIGIWDFDNPGDWYEYAHIPLTTDAYVINSPYEYGYIDTLYVGSKMKKNQKTTYTEYTTSGKSAGTALSDSVEHGIYFKIHVTKNGMYLGNFFVANTDGKIQMGLPDYDDSSMAALGFDKSWKDV